IGQGHLDAVLLPWPLASSGQRRQTDAATRTRDTARFLDTWQALEKLKQSGVVKALGVDQCLPWHLDVIQQDLRLSPAANFVFV
ncbi:hypothetical protein JKP88DRAFT_155466, partial [Tribonema minus]